MLILGEMKSILLHSRGRDLTFAAVVSLLPKVSLMRSLTRLINEKCKLYPVQGFAHQRGLTSLLMSAAMVDTCHLCRKTTPHYKEYNFFHSLLISLHTHSLTEQHFFQKMLNCADLGSYINAARTRLKLTAKIFSYLIREVTWNLGRDLLNRKGWLLPLLRWMKWHWHNIIRVSSLYIFKSLESRLLQSNGFSLLSLVKNNICFFQSVVHWEHRR